MNIGNVFLVMAGVTVAVVTGDRFVIFQCNNSSSTLRYKYFSDLPESVYDIYAVNRTSTCSLRAGAVTGQGTVTDPYRLEVDLGQGLQAQNPDCGVSQAADGTVLLQMVVQGSCEGPSSNDLHNTSSCRMHIPGSRPSQTIGRASYYCLSPATMIFNYSQVSPNDDGPADIFALGKKNTCSKTAGSGSGQGRAKDPFLIQMDATNTKMDCGVQNVDVGVYTVDVYIQQFPSLLTNADASYRLTCNTSAASSRVIETSVIPSTSKTFPSTATESGPTTSLSVVSGTGGGPVTSLIVGAPIRLVAQLLDGPATGVRISSCQACPGPGQQPIVHVLGDDGCPSHPALVPAFIGQSPEGRVAITSVFSAFKFDQSDTVYFQCRARFCYAGDLQCLGNHCAQSTRRRRDTGRRGEEVVGVTITVSANGSASSDDHGEDTLSSRGPSGWPTSALVSVACLATTSAMCSALLLGLIWKRRNAARRKGDQCPDRRQTGTRSAKRQH